MGNKIIFLSLISTTIVLLCICTTQVLLLLSGLPGVCSFKAVSIIILQRRIQQSMIFIDHLANSGTLNKKRRKKKRKKKKKNQALKLLHLKLLRKCCKIIKMTLYVSVAFGSTCLLNIQRRGISVIKKKKKEVTITFGGIPCMSKDANCKGYRMQDMRYNDRSVKGNEGEREGKDHGRQCHHTYPIGIQ